MSCVATPYLFCYSLLHVQDQFVRHGSVRLIQCESAE